MKSPNESKVTASGKPATSDGPTPTEEKRPDGQFADHWVLSDEERGKGFIRPVRRSYVHVGRKRPSNLRDLTPEESERFSQFGYVKFEAYGPERAPLTGCYWTQERLNSIESGCGQVTRMGISIAETYARKPTFYGETFCCGCGKYLAVGQEGEFVWAGTNERVGA